MITYILLLLNLIVAISTVPLIAMEAKTLEDVVRKTCICGKPGRFTCTRCKTENYCGAECQTKDWYARHKEPCGRLTQLRRSLDKACETSPYSEANNKAAMFQIALDMADEPVIQALIALGEVSLERTLLGNNKRPALFYVIEKRVIQSIEFLAKNYLGVVNSRDAWGYTPLMVACLNGYDDGVRCLLAHGASSETSCVVDIAAHMTKSELPISDGEVITPLRIAALLGELGCVRILVETVPAIIAHEEVCAGPTALACAVKMYRPDVVRYLVEKGARVDVLHSQEEGTLLHEAFSGLFGFRIIEKKRNALPSLELLRFLVNECKIDVNARSRLGNTALHLITNFGSVQAARLLVEQLGADPSVTDAHGETPLVLAQKLKRLFGNEMTNFDGIIAYFESLKR